MNPTRPYELVNIQLIQLIRDNISIHEWKATVSTLMCSNSGDQTAQGLSGLQKTEANPALNTSASTSIIPIFSLDSLLLKKSPSCCLKQHWTVSTLIELWPFLSSPCIYELQRCNLLQSLTLLPEIVQSFFFSLELHKVFPVQPRWCSTLFARLTTVELSAPAFLKGGSYNSEWLNRRGLFPTQMCNIQKKTYRATAKSRMLGNIQHPYFLVQTKL